MTLPLEFVRRGVVEHADAIAVYFGDETLTFREANDASNRIAAGFAEAGLKKGDPVGLVYGDGPWTTPVRFVAGSPKTAVGKLQRRDLRAQLRAEAEGAGGPQ